MFNTSYVGNYVCWTIRVMEPHYRAFEGTNDNWYEQLGESLEPVFDTAINDALNDILRIYKENG